MPITQRPDGAGSVEARTLTVGSPTPPKINFVLPRAAARGTEAWVVAPGLGATGSKREALKFVFTQIGLVAKDRVAYVLT